MAEHDQSWKKYFVAVTPVKRNSQAKFKLLGYGVFEECLNDIEGWYVNHKTYKAPVRLIGFTGGMLEVKISRTATGVVLDKPKIIQSFIRTSPKTIPPNGISSADPTGIDWHNYYCVINVDVSPNDDSPEVLAVGSFVDCRRYMDGEKFWYWQDGKIFVLVSLDGHVYQVSPGKKGEKLGRSVHIPSWPLPHLWR